MSKYVNRLRFAIIGIVIVIVSYFININWGLTPVEIQQFILSFGWLSPVVFIISYAIGPFVFFPTSVLSMTAGLTYGIWPGVAFIWTGALVAASTGYMIGRLFGSAVLKVHRFPWSDTLEKRMTEKGFLFVLTLRLIPVIGFGMLSYLSGVMKVRYHHYLLATMIGILPGTFIYGSLGSTLMTGSRTMIIMVVFLFTMVTGLTFIFRNRVKRWIGFD